MLLDMHMHVIEFPDMQTRVHTYTLSIFELHGCLLFDSESSLGVVPVSMYTLTIAKDKRT